MNKGSAYENNVSPRTDISVTKHGLRIPADPKNYATFAAKMAGSEQEFTRAFNGRNL